jgi:hypothetical protein
MKRSNLPSTVGKLTQKSFIGLALGWKVRKKREQPWVKLCPRKKRKNLQFTILQLQVDNFFSFNCCLSKYWRPGANVIKHFCP